MKIQCQKQSRKQGSALVITLILGVILLVTLSSYLMLINSQKGLVTRSQGWNAALTMAEAGVEEALAQMNASPNDFSANSWGASGSVYGPMAHKLIGGNYSVAIVGATTPTVYSTGYATVPITGGQISRLVRVTAMNSPLFNVALGAVSNINMNGNSPASDSWDSHDPNKSSNGHFNNYSGTNGSVASVGGLVNAGNDTFQGNLYLGPTATYNNSGTVTGTIYTDYNIQFPDAALPTINASTGSPISWISSPPVNGGIYDITAAGYYIVNSTKSIKVAPGITVVLDVQTATFNPATVTIGGGTTNSGTLKIYQESGSITLGGNSTGGAIGNRPENFLYFGLPGVTSVSLSGTSTFIGAIYAPEAALTLNGGGNSNDLEGAAIVKTVTLNGHYDFHYDEALANYGPTRGYVVTSWQEL